MTEPRFRLRIGKITLSYWRHKRGVYEASRVLRIETGAGLYRIERKDMRLGRWHVERPQRPEPIPESPETDNLALAMQRAGTDA